MLNEAQEAAASAASPAMRGPATADAGPGLEVLLRPDRGAVPFTGRAAELGELRAWRASNLPRAVRVLCGEAGVGKTRLALEVAAEHHADGGEWRLVPAGQEAGTLGAARAITAAPLLLLVEHAETREGLDKLLRAVQEDPGPVRVLLMARALGEWWDRLIGTSDRAMSRLLTKTEPLRLAASVSEDASDADLAEAAVPYFARALSLAVPERVTVEPADWRVPILVIHAATLLALLRFSTYWVASLRVVIGDHTLEDLLEYEAHHWQRAASAAGLPAETTLVKQVLAASSLLGAASVAEVADVIARVPDLTDCPNEQRVRWAQWLERLCPPGPDGRLGALQPDMLAETHVVSQLAVDSRLAQSCLRGLSAEQAERALTVLARACEHQDRAQRLIATALRDDLAGLALPAARVALQDAGDLGDSLADVLDDAPASAEVLTDIALGMPYPSKVLALAHLTATTRVVESLPDDTEQETLSEWDNREARLRSELGRVTVRREPDRDAVDPWRQTVVASPGRADPDFARPATSLGAQFSELDRPADALAAGQEAVTTYRELAAADPDRYRADLAASLANLGARLSEANHPDDAVQATAEAVTLYRELDSADPDRYRADLASCLANLGVCLSEAGGPDDAVRATTEAVTLYRKLDSADPGRYSTDLAAALTDLGMWLSGLGLPEEALEAGQQALTIRRELAAAGSDSSRADLATCLISLGVWFSEVGRPEDALEAEQEAVAIGRVLAAFAPARYRPDLAASLANLGITLSELGRLEDALAAVEEAITTYRDLAAADPRRYRPDLARCLANLGIRYAGLGRPAEALPPSEEATSIRRELTDANPDRYRPDLARSLVNLGIRYTELGRLADAVPPVQESVAIYRELAATSPGYSPELARALSSLAVALDALGRNAEAKRAEGEAAEIMQELEHSSATGPQLAGSENRGRHQTPPPRRGRPRRTATSTRPGRPAARIRA